MVDPILDNIDSTPFEEPFDYKPLEKSGFQKLEESVYSMFSKKKKTAVIKQEPLAPPQTTTQHLPEPQEVEIKIPPTHEVQNGLLFRKKTFIEKARDQLKFPVINKLNAIVNGAALVVFAAGAYILYSELPMRPELVLGIIMVSVAGNVIISQR